MPDSENKTVFALVNINGEALGDAAKLFVETVRDAIGGLARPWQIRRVAQAEGDAVVISAEAEVRAEDVYRRATARWLNEEADKQVNMEKIAANAVPQIREDAKPERIERDWLVNFFEKARLTSDEEMQQLWGKILAGEANAPGTFSKRTVNLMATLDRADAEHFQNLSRFAWRGLGLYDVTPVISYPSGTLFSENGVTVPIVTRLCEAGLATFDTAPVFGGNRDIALTFGPVVRVSYGAVHFALYPPEGKRVRLGRVGFTKAGADLFPLCNGSPVGAYRDSVIEQWTKVEEVRVRQIQPGETVPDRVTITGVATS